MEIYVVTFIADMSEHLSDADRPRAIHLTRRDRNIVCSFKEFMTMH